MHLIAYLETWTVCVCTNNTEAITRGILSTNGKCNDCWLVSGHKILNMWRKKIKKTCTLRSWNWSEPEYIWHYFALFVESIIIKQISSKKNYWKSQLAGGRGQTLIMLLIKAEILLHTLSEGLIFQWSLSLSSLNPAKVSTFLHSFTTETNVLILIKPQKL